MTQSMLATSGTAFTVDGKRCDPFLGFNAYSATATPLQTCGAMYSDAQLNELFAQMAACGTTLFRTWGFQGFGIVAIQRAVTAAAKHGIRTLLALADQWGNCEPQGYKPSSFYAGGYKTPLPGYKLSHRDWCVAIAQAFKGNGDVFGLELMNEAETKVGDRNGACDPNGAQYLRAFLDDCGAAIKQVDPQRLVSLGVISNGQCGLQGGAYQTIHASTASDYLTHHHYPGTDAGANAQPIVDAAKALNKPWITDELGEVVSVTVTPQQRADTYFRPAITTYIAEGCGAVLIWNKTLSPSQSFDVGSGDPAEALLLSLNPRIGRAQLIVQSMYQVLRGKPQPLPTTLDTGLYWVQMLSAGAPLGQVVDAIRYSPEGQAVMGKPL